MDERIESVRNATLLEIYNRQRYGANRNKAIEQPEQPAESPPEDGKGQYVDVYA